MPLEQVIYGLGIRFVGERTAQLLAEQFGSMDALITASEQELLEVNEVGPRIAESIAQFFREPRNRELIKQLREAGLKFTGKKKERSTKLARSEEHTSELQSPDHLVCRLLLEKKNKQKI